VVETEVQYDRNAFQAATPQTDRSLPDIIVFCYRIGYIGVLVVLMYRNVKLV
jgi:hypothetical protein